MQSYAVKSWNVNNMSEANAILREMQEADEIDEE